MPKSIDPELGFGYDYTVTDTKALLERAFVHNGRVCFAPEHEGTPVLVLPPGSEIRPEVMEKLASLIEAGATVVGEKPQKSPSLTDYPGSDEKVKAIADRIWGENPSASGQRTYGAGRVFWGMPLKEVLQHLGIPPDVVVHTAEGASIDYVHRRTPAVHIYFFWNRLPRWENLVARIRTESGTPEIWDPVTGKRTKLAAFRQTAEGMEVALSLPPLGTLFVLVPRQGKNPPETDAVVGVLQDGKDLLFTPSTGKPPVQIELGDDGSLRVRCETPGEYQLVLASGRRIPFMATPVQHEKLTGAWQVEFPPGWGAPEKTTFQELISWTDHPEPGIRYFSGVATYRKTFQIGEISPHQRVFIDLGEVRFVAEVMVNGHWVGNLWTPPYELDITEAVRNGENELVVRVANDWSNRLTGDAREPQFGTFTYTNIKHALAWRVPWKEAPLHRSGLLGPVTVRIVTPANFLSKGHEETRHE